MADLSLGQTMIAIYRQRLWFVTADARICAFNTAIGRIAGVVQKFTFLFAGRALIGMGVILESVPAIRAFPAGHGWSPSNRFASCHTNRVLCIPPQAELQVQR
jgi:hypothetical protein